MRYVYIFIYLFIGLSGFTVQSTIVYGVNLFTMPGMQRVVYAKSSKVLATTIVVTTIVVTAYCQTLDEATLQ